MTTPVRIHGYPISTWTRTACMTCVEKGIEYELVPVHRGSPEHEALHPFMRMPILEAGGTRVVESLAINGYLDETFPGPSLQPEDPERRAHMRMWMGLCSDYVFKDVVQGIPRGRQASEDELATARSVLERLDALAGDDAFLTGEDLTLADLYLAPQVSNAREKAPAVLDGLERLAAWMRGMEARDSFTRTAYDSPAP